MDMHDRPSSAALEVFAPRSDLRSLTSAIAALFGPLLALLPRRGPRRPAPLERRPSPVIDGASWGDLRGIEDRIAGALPAPGTLLVDDGIDEATRAELASYWRDRGCGAQASVAWFAEATRDLALLGAPAELLAAANHDAESALGQAELCFGIARAIDGRCARPGPFGSGARPRSIAELAVEVFAMGLRSETASRIAAKAGRRATDPVVRATLERIAEIEGEHATHARARLVFCIDCGGADLARALRASLPEVRSELPASAREGGWERWGVAGASLEAREIERARAWILACAPGRDEARVQSG